MQIIIFPIKVHSLPIRISYTDNLGREGNFITEIGLPLNAKPFYLPNLQQTEIKLSESKGKITPSIFNIGKANINFLILELLPTDDYIILSSQKSYLGNLKSDDFETGQFEIYVKKNENNPVSNSVSYVNLSFIMHYKDEYGKKYSDTFILQNPLYSQKEAVKLGLIKPKNTNFLLLVFIVIVVLIFVFRRKKKTVKR